MLYVLYTLHVIVCLFLILVVLLQQGKGADLSVFGGGGSQAAFGPRGATTLLHKLTVWCFVGFTLLTISIGFLAGRDRGSSVMRDADAPPAATAPAESEDGVAAGTETQDAEVAPAATDEPGEAEAADGAGTATAEDATTPAGDPAEEGAAAPADPGEASPATEADEATAAPSDGPDTATEEAAAEAGEAAPEA